MPTLQDASILARQLRTGDLIFIRIPHPPFHQIADHTLSWVNHVGVVVQVNGADVTLAESRVPFSTTTTLERFVARSGGRRVAVARLAEGLTPEQEQALVEAVRLRLGVLYDTGFNLASRRQFCSRFVREVLQDATGRELGQVQRFEELLAANPRASLRFWRFWFFGRIPWKRLTITPASLLASPNLAPVFEGVVG